MEVAIYNYISISELLSDLVIISCWQQT